MRRVALTSVVATALALAAVPRVAPAQRAPRFSCDGLVVSSIVVNAKKPNVGGIYDRLRALGRKRQDMHITTRESIIRRFLALREGERCTDLRRSESARILRAQPFIADATVTASPDSAGGVRIDVTTVDELSIVVGASVAGGDHKGIQKVELGTLNLRGQAVSVLGEWQQGFAYRDLWALQLTDYQTLGRPYQLALSAERRSLGGAWEATLSHPFFTDLQRVAWLVAGGEDKGYPRFLRDDAPSPSVMLDRSYLDVGGVVRIGVPGVLSLFGASVSRARVGPGARGVLVTDSGLVADPDSVLDGRYPEHRTLRVNALWGVRNVSFVRVTGFDALDATQDVRTGFQLGTIFGRGLTAAGAGNDDIFVSTDLYAGMGSPRAFLGLQLQGEGRQDYDANRWDGVVGSGRVAWYIKPAMPQTTIASVEYGGGWRQRTPFQLSLGDEQGGVRGYRRSRVGGSQRLVGRLEHRWLLPLRKIPNSRFGLAFFGDAGRMWAGDAPYGMSTGINASAGLGILGAVPAGSRRLWRLDVAVPLGPDKRGSWVIGLTSRDRTRTFWQEPPDVRRGRERGTPASIFNWP